MGTDHSDIRPTVRDAQPSEAAAVSRTLAAAFARNPFVRWLLPDDDRYARVSEALFRLSVDRELDHGVVHTIDGHGGAALWLPPDSPEPGILDQLGQLFGVVPLLGLRTPAGLRATMQMEAKRAEAPPNWYLTILGTVPEQQGTGIGSALLRPMLERCDREGVAAYLESSDPDNVPYYERFGFRVIDELRFPDGPRMPLMLRDPA